MSEHEEVKQVKELHKEAILAKPNVVGVGTGYKIRGKRTTDELCVVAMVRQKIPKAGLAPEALVPPGIDGVPTDVMQVGDLSALQTPTDRWRPAPGGVSLGHYQVTAGTFGTVVRDRSSGDRLILSNNHVLANSNDASVGDPILQPGAVDGGHVANDTLAYLERFCPIEFITSPPVCPVVIGMTRVANALARLLGSRHRFRAYQTEPTAINLVDAAVARPLDDAEILDEILQIGLVDGMTPAMLGMSVRKSGRTTGFTSGVITVLNSTVDVSYGPGRTARFENQIITSAMSQGGDSGSLLVAGDSLQAVGLLFAGSDQVTIHNPIELVLDCLDVVISEGASGDVDAQTALEKAQAVKKAYEGELMSKENVVGVGTGLRQRGGKPTEDVAIVVMVKKKVPPSQLGPEDIIPAQIEGVPVDVQEVGEIRAH
jgi:hypothetical protein